MALAHSKGLPLGSPAPSFRLRGTDGDTYDLESFASAKALVVVFTCNHCPYAKAYEQRFVDLVRDYRERGVALVAINPNDDRSHPEDSFEEMKVRADERGFNFPYLRDDTQAIARAFGAVCTPDIFVFDDRRELRYAGRVDDNWRDAAAVERHELRDALDAILSKRAIDFPITPAMGCSIKWRS
jgi:peroxiredoxin